MHTPRAWLVQALCIRPQQLGRRFAPEVAKSSRWFQDRKKTLSRSLNPLSDLAKSPSGLRRRLRRLRLAPRQLRPVQREEIHLIEVQRRISAIARHVADDPPQVGEDQPRALDHQERVQLLGRYVLDQEKPSIVKLQDEDLRLARAASRP